MSAGWFSLLAAHMGCSVLAVEPNSHTAQLMRKSIALNGHEQNVVLRDCVLKSEETAVPLRMCNVRACLSACRRVRVYSGVFVFVCSCTHTNVCSHSCMRGKVPAGKHDLLRHHSRDAHTHLARYQRILEPHVCLRADVAAAQWQAQVWRHAASTACGTSRRPVGPSLS